MSGNYVYTSPSSAAKSRRSTQLRSADTARAAMLILLFMNIAMGIMLFGGTSEQTPIAADQWHGNASGAAME